MAKRSAPESTEHNHSKRRKASPPAESEELNTIQNASDLATLLAFEQGAEKLLRDRWRHFKKFLRAIEDQRDADSDGNRAILLQFLQQPSPKQGEDETAICSNAFQAWHYASSIGHTELLTTIPSVLTILLGLCAHLEALSSSGRQICRSIIRKDNLLLVERCLTPSQQRPEQVIACLELLNEVVSYDLGSFAGALHRQGSRAFKLAEGCLSNKASRKGSKAVSSDAREAAIKFILRNLRYQTVSAKAEIVGQSHIAQHLFQGIETESPALISQILEYSQRYVLNDQKLSTSLRSRFLSHSTLLALVRVTRSAHRRENDEAYAHAGSQAYEILMTECLKDEADDMDDGHEEPLGTGDNVTNMQVSVDINITASLDIMHNDRSLVRKAAMAALLQDLRPDTNLWERKLVLAIFQKHPRTETEYFTKRKSQYFDPPKLTTTWIGHASFLIAVLRLPPLHDRSRFLRDKPTLARAEKVSEAIMPTSIQREVMERCFNQSSELVTHMVAQIATAALHRLTKFSQSFAARNKAERQQLDLLATAFTHRFPRPSVILGAHRRCGVKDSLLKASLAKLLRSCFTALPKFVSGERLDVSKTVGNALQKLEDTEKRDFSAELERQELESFMWLSTSDPLVKWFNKPDNLRFSPFTTVLRTASQDLGSLAAFELSIAIAHERSIVQQKDTRRGITALVQSLSRLAEVTNADIVYEFLDSCLFFLDKRPMKYVGSIYELLDKVGLEREEEDHKFSPLIMAISEQWPFVRKNKTEKEQVLIAKWVAQLLDALDDIGENRSMLQAIRDDIVGLSDHAKLKSVLQKAVRQDKPIVQSKTAETTVKDRPSSQEPAEAAVQVRDMKSLELLKLAMDEQLRPPVEADDHPELARWQTKDIEDTMDDGHAASLLYCLSSEQAPVRRQALSQLGQLKSRLAAYKLSQDKAKVTLGLCYWIIGQVIETVEQLDEDLTAAPVPYFVPAFGSRAIAITRDPTHVLFAKLNQFLDSRPWWTVSKMPKQWVDRIVWRAPERPGGKWTDMLWLVALLRDGLRTPRDVALYFHANVFEPLLCRCLPGAKGSKGGGTPLAVWIAVVDLLYAYAAIEGGARTLVTRFGLLAWMHARLGHPELAEPVKMRVRCLAKKLGEMAEEKAMEEWSGGRFQQQVEALWEDRLEDYF